MQPFLGSILLVAHLLHPINDLPVELFLNGKMGHRCRWRCPMPVLLAGRKPDHIPGPDLLDWAAPALCPTAAERDDQGLTERMCMPRGTGAGRKGDAGALHKRRIRRLKQWIDSNGPREPPSGPFCGRLCTGSLD